MEGPPPEGREDIAVDVFRQGNVRPEYAKLQAQLRLLEDVAMKLLEPYAVSELQVLCSNLMSASC